MHGTVPQVRTREEAHLGLVMMDNDAQYTPPPPPLNKLVLVSNKIPGVMGHVVEALRNGLFVCLFVSPRGKTTPLGRHKAGSCAPDPGGEEVTDGDPPVHLFSFSLCSGDVGAHEDIHKLLPESPRHQSPLGQPPDLRNVERKNPLEKTKQLSMAIWGTEMIGNLSIGQDEPKPIPPDW